MKQYKISCTCGEDHWVKGSLAGQMFTCIKCENEFQLASLSKMSSLESREEHATYTKRDKRRAKSASRSKIDELAIFSIGFGIIIAALLAWIALVVKSDPDELTAAFYVFPIIAAVVLIAVGIAVKTIRTKNIVINALALLAGLFLIDSILFFHFVKLLISAAIVTMIAKCCIAAISEIENENI